MSPSFLHTIKLLRNLLQPGARVVIDSRNYRAVVPLPAYVSKAFFSDEKLEEQSKPSISSVSSVKSGEPKTSITTLITTEYPKDKERERLIEEAETGEAREASWRTMKYTLIFFGVTFVCLGSYLVLEFGKPRIGDDGNLLQDEYSHMPVWRQYFYRTIRELDYYKRLIKEPSREKLLPDELQLPYFQPAYTLVLELTDVLVHPDWTYQTGWRFKKRPGIDQFLESLSGSYEIVVYTAEQGMTVFPIIDALDPKNLIMYKLVRDATHFVDGVHVKNLDKLNRNLKKVIVIDWNMESVKFHPDNVFHIPRWNGNDDDTTLIDLAAFLLTVANSDVEDVRDVLRYYNNFENGLATFREKQRTLLEEQEADKRSRTQNALNTKNWSHSFLKKPTPVI